jgi:hypothetical protein
MFLQLYNSLNSNFEILSSPSSAGNCIHFRNRYFSCSTKNESVSNIFFNWTHLFHINLFLFSNSFIMRREKSCAIRRMIMISMNCNQFDYSHLYLLDYPLKNLLSIIKLGNAIQIYINSGFFFSSLIFIMIFI